jgi:hypothetical protein
VDINPVQDLSQGDPSPENICPISGWTQVDVEQSGKNVFDADSFLFTAGYVSSNDGMLSNGGTKVSKTADYIPCGHLAGQTITINHRPGYGYSPGVAFYDADKVFISGVANDSSSSTGAWSMTVPATAEYMRITVPYEQTEVQIELGSTATDYEPYTGRSITIDLGQTVYGGKLDVLTGILTVYPYYASYNGETLTGEWISDRDVYTVGTTPTIGAQVVNIGAEGTEYQLDPHEIASLLGANNIWADTGDTEVEYRANTELWVQRKIAEAISALS